MNFRHSSLPETTWCPPAPLRCVEIFIPHHSSLSNTRTCPASYRPTVDRQVMSLPCRDSTAAHHHVCACPWGLWGSFARDLLASASAFIGGSSIAQTSRSQYSVMRTSRKVSCDKARRVHVPIRSCSLVVARRAGVIPVAKTLHRFRENHSAIRRDDMRQVTSRAEQSVCNINCRDLDSVH